MVNYLSVYNTMCYTAFWYDIQPAVRSVQFTIKADQDIDNIIGK